MLRVRYEGYRPVMASSKRRISFCLSVIGSTGISEILSVVGKGNMDRIEGMIKLLFLLLVVRDSKFNSALAVDDVYGNLLNGIYQIVN
ncbi:hypothetical protein L1049_019949 [Liquidambar formosana]|uniref:Uncharacterized protein n=1 Tax=Liquidambar formosana TaxID=63359 RepID=A0AAP0X6Y0_LIQFO